MRKLFTIGLFLITILALGVSAADLQLSTTSISVVEKPTKGFSTSFTATNNGTATLSGLSVSLSGTELNGFNVIFSPASFNLAASASQVVTITGLIPEDINTRLSPFSGTVTVSGAGESESLTLNVNAESQLRLDNVKFVVDGKSKSIDEISPGDTVKFTGEIENLFTDDEDIQIEDVEIEITIESIDDGGDDDLEEAEEVGDIDADDEESFSIEFEIPLDVDEGNYDVIILVEGEDENGAKHFTEWELILKIIIPVRVGVLVEFPNGTIYTECLDATNQTDGYELMQKTDLDLLWGPETTWGRMLCKINGVGTDVIGQFCEYSGSFWNYVLDKEGNWLYLPLGLSGGDECWNRDFSWNNWSKIVHYCAKEGDVLGFAYGAAGSEPTYDTFSRICGSYDCALRIYKGEVSDDNFEEVNVWCDNFIDAFPQKEFVYPQSEKVVLHYLDKCSYPELMNCCSTAELQTVVSEWEYDLCNMDSLLQCIGQWESENCTSITATENCIDGIDNDNDGFIDSEDQDCYEYRKISLTQGWNLVASPFDIIINSTIALSSVEGCYKGVYSFTQGIWNMLVPGNPFSNIDVIQPDKGYWINVNCSQVNWTTAKKEKTSLSWTVLIKDLKLNPQELTIKKRDTVTWKHRDTWDGNETRHYLAAHTNEFRSPILYYGDTFEHTFNEIGTFTYLDVIYKERDDLRGTIIVK